MLLVALQAAIKQLQKQGLLALPASSSDSRSVKQVRPQQCSWAHAVVQTQGLCLGLVHACLHTLPGLTAVIDFVLKAAAANNSRQGRAAYVIGSNCLQLPFMLPAGALLLLVLLLRSCCALRWAGFSVIGPNRS
eukprot:GHRQ01032322.1.p1 GENE.GHRQ01032322.1~~GHRQ01032322.1.p1  ORF type:complete len:134 (+),score=24.20 GHRQ01032322.1:56-457(+)